jgi:hypothetical protein
MAFKTWLKWARSNKMMRKRRKVVKRKATIRPEKKRSRETERDSRRLRRRES